MNIENDTKEYTNMIPYYITKNYYIHLSFKKKKC